MDIYVIGTASSANVDDSLLEEYRKKSFLNENKCREHSFAYLMLDRILKENYEIENRDIVFDEGKPKLKNGAKHFSLSHSGEFIAIAVSDFNCGIDIEKIKDRDYVSISKRMKINCSSLFEFFIEWTKYEAGYKLNETPKTFKSFNISDYILSAASNNEEEKFELFIQN